jgi:SAM-dependent methyltransferase
LSGAADLDQAIHHYRGLAPRYDHYTRRINRIRRQAIDALALREGDCVLDAGCGTGWCIPYLRDAVGASGHVIAFDPSPEMLEVARDRLGTTPASSCSREPPNACACPPAWTRSSSATRMDVIRSRAALDNLLAQANPGARVAGDQHQAVRELARSGELVLARDPPRVHHRTSTDSTRPGRCWLPTSKTST